MIEHQNHVYIDPDDCESEVGYHISTGEYKGKTKTTYSINATVVLADCSRKIAWGFTLEDEEKIDKAISMLQEFRKKYIATVKTVNDLNK